MTASETFSYPERALTERMSSWATYFKRLTLALVGIGTELSLGEKVLFATLVLAVVISTVDCFNGKGIGDQHAVWLAKQNAQQELMAQRADKK